jgi:hypothetical protein
MAQSGHSETSAVCLLAGAKRTFSQPICHETRTALVRRTPGQLSQRDALQIGRHLVGDRWQRVAQDFERDQIELDGHHWF